MISHAPSSVITRTGFFVVKKIKNSEQVSDFSSKQRIVTIVMAIVLAASGVGSIIVGCAFPIREVKAETRPVSPSGITNQSALEGYSVKPSNDQGDTPTASPTPSSSESVQSQEDAEYNATIIALESLGYSTEHYAERHEKIEQYRKELIDKGCQEINLEACSNWLYATDNCGYFADPSFIYPEKTKLSNYVSRDEVIEFGKIGEVDESWNWKVIYHKDENGKLTNEPGLMYAYNPENKVFDTKYVQSPIDSWEKIAPGFFRTLNDNDAWVLFQSDATDPTDKIEGCKYGRSILYDNTSSNDSGDFENFLYKMVFPKEQFGARGDALLGDDEYARVRVGLVKSRLALDCCEYISTIKSIKFIKGRIESFQAEADLYLAQTPGVSGEDIQSFKDEMELKELVTPFGADSWAEIDAAIATRQSN